MSVFRASWGGMLAIGRRFDLPLDHDAPEGERIPVFAREVVAAEKAEDDLPYLLFLQGGPGGESPRPPTRSGWLERALEEFRVLLLDQRGTGLSAPLTARTLAGLEPAEQARRLSLHRADAIVRDAEAIRRELIGDEPWSLLGQSFGGFCVLTYLSLAPEGVREAFVTGGLPDLEAPAEEVYRRTARTALAKGEAFDRDFPHARAILDRVAERVRRGDVRLPDGSRLSVRRVQHLGVALGASTGAPELAYLLERAFAGGTGDLSEPFLRGVQERASFATNPLYAALHEPIYAQGQATRWAAQRVRDGLGAFDDPERPRFTGETIFPWMFDEIPALRPLREAAEILAAKDDWPALYDPERLARNEAPVAAAVYVDDMYVPFDLSMRTAARVAGLRAWATNEFEHDGLKADGATILDRLVRMARGRV